MEIENLDRYRVFNSMLVAATLIVITCGLVAVIALAAGAASEVDEGAARHLLRLAVIAVVLLAFNVVMMFWLVIRILAHRSSRSSPPHRADYIDPWAEAGARFQLDEEDAPPTDIEDDQDDEDDDEEDPDV